MCKSLNYFILFLFCGLIFWLSAQETLPSVDLMENEDKIEHLLAYAVMGILAWRAFSHWPLSRYQLFLATFGFCSLYGLTDEWHQSFVIGRHSSALDWLADSIGGMLAGSVSYWYSRHSKKSGASAG